MELYTHIGSIPLTLTTLGARKIPGANGASAQLSCDALQPGTKMNRIERPPLVLVNNPEEIQGCWEEGQGSGGGHTAAGSYPICARSC